MPSANRLVIVTATTNLNRAADCIASWSDVAQVVVTNGGAAGYLGSVPAFELGVNRALQQYSEAEIIACLHDDLEIHDRHWIERVLGYFDENPAMGLAGFGGAIGLGDADIYQKDYAPQQLARVGFRSNLSDAEAHGRRSLVPERVACLDGFSQIGRRAFWQGMKAHYPGNIITGLDAQGSLPRPWTVLKDLGIVHHFYDGALGCLAARAGWETWYLPISCTHYGGRTAVGDPGYAKWAASQPAGGDHGFWREAHRIGYEAFRDVLPLRV